MPRAKNAARYRLRTTMRQVMRISSQPGFTLIELMIVVAIIGILAAIAIPAYQDYTVRAQVTEGLNLAATVKTGVSEYYANNGAWPNSITGNGTAKLGWTADPTGKYVSDINLSTGSVITIVYGGNANAANLSGKTLTLTPGTSVNGDIVWQCGSRQMPAVPVLTAAAGATFSLSGAGGTLPQKYRSNECRG